MKTFILTILMVISLSGAKVDTALFEGENVSNYFEKIQKDINSTMTQKLKSKETILLEFKTLEKLKKLYLVKDDIRIFETILLDSSNIDEELYLNAFYLLGDLKVEINRLEIKERDIQKKLFSLKNIIEKSIPNDENGSLLNNQLQYAFYKISQEKITKSLRTYIKIFNKEFDLFRIALSKVRFKGDSAKKIIKRSDKKLDSINQENLLLSIDKDSEALRDKNNQKEIISKQKNIQKEKDLVFNKKMKAQVLLSLKCLNERNREEFLEITGHMENEFQILSVTNKQRLMILKEILVDFGDRHFNKASMAVASSKQAFGYMEKHAQTIMNKTIFVYEEKAISIKTIIVFALILFVGLVIARVYKKIVDRFRKKNRIKSLSIARLIANSGYYLIILSSFFIALDAIGLDTHTIFVITGAILLWLALGLQGFISNYAMGILLKIDRSIRIADHIELDKNIVGVVDDMDFRSITILTSDNSRYTIPNSRFIAGAFINHSLEDSTRRIQVPFSVDKRYTLEVVQQKVLDALDNSDVIHLKSIDKKARVIITDINRKIVRYSLLVWVKKRENPDMDLLQSSFFNVIQQGLIKL